MFRSTPYVIAAQAGIQFAMMQIAPGRQKNWIPAFAGMTPGMWQHGVEGGLGRIGQ